MVFWLSGCASSDAALSTSTGPRLARGTALATAINALHAALADGQRLYSLGYAAMMARTALPVLWPGPSLFLSGGPWLSAWLRIRWLRLRWEMCGAGADRLRFASLPRMICRLVSCVLWCGHKALDLRAFPGLPITK